MFCTGDFSIEGIISETNTCGYLNVCVPLPRKVALAFLSAEHKGITTRSRLARRGTELLWLGEPQYRKGMLHGLVSCRSHIHPIQYHLGDKVGKFYAYNDSERLSGMELARAASGIDGRIAGEKVIVAVSDYRYLVDPGADSSRALGSSPLAKELCTEWQQDFLVVDSLPVNIPKGVFGYILGSGNGAYHLNSRIISPGHSGPVALELTSVHSKPSLELALYLDTSAGLVSGGAAAGLSVR